MSVGALDRVGSSIAIVAGSRLMSAVLQAATLVLIARATPVYVFGLLATTLAVLLFVAVAAEAGLDTHCSRCVAQSHMDDASHSNGLHLLLSAAIATTGVFALSLAALFRDEIPIELALLPIYVMAERRLAFRLSNLIALRRPSSGVGPLLLGRAITLGAVASLLALGDASPITLFAAAGLAGSLFSIALLGRQPRVGMRFPNVASAGPLFSASRAYWAATMSGQLRNLDVVAVGVIASPAAAALYALPARAVAPLRLLGTSVAAVAFPMAARNQSAQLRHLNFRIGAVTGLAIALTLAAWPWVPEVAALIVGERYRASGDILRVFMLGAALNLLGSLLSSELQGYGDSRFVAHMGIGLVVVFYAALGFGVWTMGAVGAAWGTTAAFAAQFLVVTWRIRKMEYLR